MGLLRFRRLDLKACWCLLIGFREWFGFWNLLLIEVVSIR